MSYTKEQIEESLLLVLKECLESLNQEGSLLSLEYDEETETCNVKLSVHIIEEEDYIGFAGY